MQTESIFKVELERDEYREIESPYEENGNATYNGKLKNNIQRSIVESRRRHIKEL